MDSAEQAEGKTMDFFSQINLIFRFSLSKECLSRELLVYQKNDITNYMTVATKFTKCYTKYEHFEKVWKAKS